MRTRRSILGAGLAVAVSGITGACGRRGDEQRWRFFTASEARTVDAICAQLIPADRDPGAREARVVNYIDIQLTRHFRKHQLVYRQGIAGVDAASRRQFGKSYVELPAAQQEQILKQTEEHARTFFQLILSHTRQGFYGDPRHGGNYNMASWKMVGLPFPPLRGREHYNQAG